MSEASTWEPVVPPRSGGPVFSVNSPIVPAPALSMSLRSAGASNNSGSALNAPPQTNGHKAHGVAAPSDGGETSGLKRLMSSQGGSGKEKVLRLDGGA